jgi:hypothetical protein
MPTATRLPTDAGTIGKRTVLTESQQVITRAAIQVGELLDFIAALPDRPVVRRFPDRIEDTRQLAAYRDAIMAMNRNAFVVSENELFILQTARKQSGWLCLEFGSALPHVESHILKHEATVVHDADARQVVDAIRQIEARTEMGVGCEEYSQIMASNWLSIRDFVNYKANSYPVFVGLTKNIFENYCTALHLWRKGAGLVPIQFMGGGFGLKGAAEGMAIGLALNSLVGVVNNAKQASLNKRLADEWAVASKRIRVIERIMRSALKL